MKFGVLMFLGIGVNPTQLSNIFIHSMTVLHMFFMLPKYRNSVVIYFLGNLTNVKYLGYSIPDLHMTSIHVNKIS